MITGAHVILYSADADADRAFLRDLLGTRTERPLMVHEANAPRRYATWGLFLGVFGFAGLGTLLILQGTGWRKPRA